MADLYLLPRVDRRLENAGEQAGDLPGVIRGSPEMPAGSARWEHGVTQRDRTGLANMSAVACSRKRSVCQDSKAPASRLDVATRPRTRAMTDRRGIGKDLAVFAQTLVGSASRRIRAA